MSMSNRLSLGRLNIPTKLTILVAAIGIVALALAGVFVRRQLIEISALENERQGLAYLRQLHSTFQLVQQHRDATSLEFSKAETTGVSNQAELESLRGLVSNDFETLAEMDQRLGVAVGSRDLFADLHRNWNNIESRFDRLDAQQSFDAHGRLLDDMIDLALTIGEGSGLRTTDDLASFYLADTAMSRLLDVSEDLARLQVRGIEVAQVQSADVEQRQELRSLQANVQVELAAIDRSLELAFVQGFGLRQEGEDSWKTAESRAAVFLAFTDQELLRVPAEGEFLSATPDLVAATGSEALAALYAVSSVELNSLGRRLDERLDRLRLQLYVASSALLLGFLLSGLLAFLIARGLTRQLGAITDTLAQIGIGNFEARAEVLTEDELGTVAESMNGMLGNTLALIQSREERDAQQASIMKLLDEVSGVAEGDLSRDAEVTPEITGAIADAFNFMIDQLRQVVGNIQGTAVQVGDAADEIQGTTESLAESSDLQSQGIIEASSKIRGMAASMQSVSIDAVKAAEVARQSLEGALRGAKAASKTAAGMNNVRQEVQETSKRIKRLSESSQEIGEIAKVINEIADRTGMLALNASIQAASAGEAGRGFAVVAAEVERLAVRAADATKRIDELIRTIQSETGEVIIAMEETTREVVEGSALAAEAGATLAEIENVSKELAQLVGGISDASTVQADTSENVARTMEQISEVSQLTSTGSRNAALSVQGLAALVVKLRDSVRTFKLPSE